MRFSSIALLLVIGVVINNEAKGTEVVGAHSIEEFVSLLKTPRRVMMMVKAGDTVDHMIDAVLPFLDSLPRQTASDKMAAS